MDASMLGDRALIEGIATPLDEQPGHAGFRNTFNENLMGTTALRHARHIDAETESGYPT